MGLFGAIKNSFNKTIALDDDKKECLIYRKPLKNDLLKINAEIDVQEGFEVILCHMDTVCDCLTPGKYKFNDVHAPRLYKYVKPRKTKKGYVTPKSIPADLYYINKGLIENLRFKTYNKFKVMHQSKKIKIKIEGSYDLKISNSYKLVDALKTDYALLTDSRVKLELGAYVGYSIAKICERNIFKAEEVDSSNKVVLDKLNEGLAKYLASIGVEIQNLKIDKVYMPRGVAVEVKSNTTDSRIEEIFNTAYGNPIKEDVQKEETVEREAVFVEKPKATFEASAKLQPEKSVINLGYGGFDGGVSRQEQKPTTEEEYERATQSFEQLSNKKAQTLVFLGGEGKEPPAEKLEESTDKDIMLGRSAVRSIGVLGKVDIEDDFVQRQRKIQISDIKESIEEKIERPKVAKENSKICAYCGAKITEKYDFCPKCGKSIKKVKHCKACGEDNDISASTCKLCGSKL